MSRASALRDAIRDEIAERLDVDIESQLVPYSNREELTSGPKLFVRRGTRSVSYEQGPDVRLVTVQVGVVGLLDPAEGANTNPTLYRAQQVDQSDQYDELLERVIALWSPDGPLARKRLAEHSYEGITEDQSFDPQKLYDSGIYLSVISLTYQDVIDD